MSVITSPIFLQSASNIKREPDAYITMQYNVANPVLYAVSSNGKVKVQSTYQGQLKVETYASLSDTQVSIQADANTEIKLIGKITKIDSLRGYGGTQGMKAINFVGQDELTFLGFGGEGKSHTGLTSLDLSACAALTSLSCGDCYYLTSIDLSACTALTSLNCGNCRGLTSLELQHNTALTSLNCGNCIALTTINCIANNSDVSTEIAGAITGATSTDGTVCVASTDTYYSTIKTAATTKGWTIEEPQA